MKRIIAAACALMLALGLSAPAAQATDGFNQPAYYAGSTPAVHQTQYCLEFSGTSKPCYRWVRQGGTFMQGPKAQKNNELPLIYDVCSYGFVRHYGIAPNDFWAWEWHDLSARKDFCYVNNSVTGYHWSAVAPLYP